MGTRSVIAIPDAELGWQGRYCHWDGYPTGVGETLRQLVNRETYAIAVENLVHRHYGWSNLSTTEAGPLSPLYADGRFQVVLGYGTAYTEVGGQSSPDEWITPAGDDWGTEWCYLLGEDGIAVFENDWTQEEGHRWVSRGFVSYRDAAGMERLEQHLYPSPADVD
jgi:hypothetical protein